jgi:hypothetical protein
LSGLKHDLQGAGFNLVTGGIAVATSNTGRAAAWSAATKPETEEELKEVSGLSLKKVRVRDAACRVSVAKW